MTKGYTPHALPSDQFPSRGEHGCIPRRALPVSKASGTKVLVIQYRLAPEHPHPAAVQDAVMAYRWPLKSGFPPRNIVIAGDSAGGGLR